MVDALPMILPLVLSDVCFDAGGRRLIDRVGFTLREGEPTLVVGPNGAGKSLLLRLCHGLIAPRSGTISWAGAKPAQVRRRHAMVFQRPVLLRRSAAANVAYALKLKGFAWRRRAGLARDILAQAGLAHLAERPARVLSAGEQQRLAIARALALQPDALFLDEPTANLDPAASRAIEELILSIGRAGTKIVMTTHDLAQVRRLGGEVLFLHRGRLLAQQPAEDFFRRPASADAAAFIDGKLLA